DDPRFANNTLRTANRAALDAQIAECFARLTRDEAEARLERAQIATARVNTTADLWQHPQLKARERWTEITTPAGAVPALYPPGRNSGFTPRMDGVPALGQHTDAVLGELGFDAGQIAGWHAA